MKFYYQIEGSIEVNDNEDIEISRGIARAHLQECCKNLPSAELCAIQTKEEKEKEHIS